jgi:hypothetical protein
MALVLPVASRMISASISVRSSALSPECKSFCHRAECQGDVI